MRIERERTALNNLIRIVWLPIYWPSRYLLLGAWLKTSLAEPESYGAASFG
jgi:hypothetical protein